jgi:hypothetical protein
MVGNRIPSWSKQWPPTRFSTKRTGVTIISATIDSLANYQCSFYRLFVTRTDRYKNVMAATNRLHELGSQHKWTADEADDAIALLDEPGPMNLHQTGALPFWQLGISRR